MAATLPFRDINVHSSPSYYAFSSPSTPSAPTLVVERPSGDFRLKDGKVQGSKRVTSIAGIMGMIKLRLDKYIIVITKAQPVGRIKGHMVYKIVSTELLPLRERPLHDPDEDIYVALVKAQLKGPMYFSYSFDLTNTFQRQVDSDLSSPLWKRADDRFFWNRFIQTDLIDFRIGTGAGYGGRGSLGAQPAVDAYILPVMFGMLEIKNTSIKTTKAGKVNNTPLTFILITRRSRLRAGTRYFSRGVDENGNVSNFNETEQIVILNDHASGGLGGFGANEAVGGRNGKEAQVFSYVQTRGSVPVYWAEINTLKYTPKLQVRNVNQATNSAKKHFDQQISLYGRNFLVNLVNQKGRELRVKEAYEDMVKILNPHAAEKVVADRVTNEKLDIIDPQPGNDAYSQLTYIYFDFHNETKGLQWHKTKDLLERLKNRGLREHGYFCGIDMPGDTQRMEVRKRQTAVVRTNCMDCLDRTNVVQSMLGRYFLSVMLVDLGLLDEGKNAEDDKAFEFIFRNMWADNADVVSKAYSGTGALKTDFTRTGNRTNAGKFADLSNSITRYVKNNFLDGPRQDAYDVFLGAYLPESVSSRLQFADRRPLLIQSIPYLLAASLFFVFVGSFTRRDAEAMVWPLRLAMVSFFFVTVGCLHFILTHGTLYVNWPKLNTPPWATESYQEALSHVQSAPVIGGMVNNKHERGKSDARLGFLEEGKKRIE